jgi:hypothetical protein
VGCEFGLAAGEIGRRREDAGRAIHLEPRPGCSRLGERAKPVLRPPPHVGPASIDKADAVRGDEGDASGTQHSMHLADGPMRVLDVLEDLGAEDAIELRVIKWKLLARADDVYGGAGIRIESDISAFEVGKERLVGPLAAADIQDGDCVTGRPTAGNFASELDTEGPEVDVIRAPGLRGEPRSTTRGCTRLDADGALRSSGSHRRGS